MIAVHALVVLTGLTFIILSIFVFGDRGTARVKESRTSATNENARPQFSNRVADVSTVLSTVLPTVLPPVDSSFDLLTELSKTTFSFQRLTHILTDQWVYVPDLSDFQRIAIWLDQTFAHESDYFHATLHESQQRLCFGLNGRYLYMISALEAADDPWLRTPLVNAPIRTVVLKYEIHSSIKQGGM